MTIHFYLRFHTKFQETLSISGNAEELGANDATRKVPMNYLNNDFWHVELNIDSAALKTLNYKYILTNADGFEVIEWGNDREISLPGNVDIRMQVIDTWNHAGEFENAFFTAPFQETLLAHHRNGKKIKTPKHFTHIFKVKAPLLTKNEVLCLAGSGIALGEWDTEKPVLLAQEDNWWTVRLDIPKESFPAQYKYGVYNTKEKKFTGFESGDNRILFGEAANYQLTVLHDGFAHLPNNTWRGAGVAIPVFSLRSKNSFGVGEFNDLTLLVDWAKSTGLSLIQILPINDTTATHTWTDSYPYAAISAFALHPIYINLEKAAGKKYASLIKPLKKKQKELNALTEVDYETVMRLKLSALRELYNLHKEEFLEDKDYQDFFNDNKHWLVPYAAFCYLRDANGTADSSKWKSNSNYSPSSVGKLVSPKSKQYHDIAFQYFIQYHLHLQLLEATEYAHANGIIVKGDIPIGIYRYSCDAWVNPRLYNMDMQAGAPPDDFAIKGQNWGFPTYNWHHMEEDGYAWWKQRFEQMSNYFDAFRIDHILGFFRIWSIPTHSLEGVMGHFVPAIPVHLNEFHERGVWFDHYRYTKPYITDQVLLEYFGDNDVYVKEHFLKPATSHQLELKDEFNTQVKVEAYFAGLEKNEHNEALKSGLFSLISNVILFEHDGSLSLQFHFRIAMDQTSSFRNLEWNTQQQLKELYVHYFFHRQDYFWMQDAMHKLPALKASTNMLVCGEDLGMVPHCVKEVMSQLGLLSLEIQRMPKDPQKEFFHPNDAPYLSVVTPSTHDLSTIRGWWEENREATQHFFNHELGQWGTAPFFCEPWINKMIVLQHLHSPAMWSIFQLQDILGMSEALRRESPEDERINIPANPKHYWRYRMHIPLEQLIKEKEFNKELKEYVEMSGR